MLNHRLQIAECLFIAGSVVGCAIAVVSGQLIYAAVPVSIALLLNLINRLRFEQRTKRRLNGALAQLQRRSQENYFLNEQQLEEAIASLQAKLPEYFSQIEASHPYSSAGNIIQLDGQLASLEQCLSSVVQYLNSASLPERVEQLEKAIASLSAQIAQIQCQLADTKKSRTNEIERRLQANQPKNAQAPLTQAVTEASLFPATPKSVPVPQAVSPTPPTKSIPVKRQNVSSPLPAWNPLHTLTGHSDWVRSLAISPDGQTLASGSFDKTIKLWQLSSGKLNHTLSRHSKGVLCVVISPEGQILASGSFDETIKLWCLDTGELIQTLTGHSGSVRALAITSNGQTLVSGSFDETIKLWRLDTGELFDTLTEKAGWVSAIALRPRSANALSPDGQTIVSAGIDGIITRRQLDITGAGTKPEPQARTLSGNLSSVCSLAISPDGQILAAGCTDGNVKLWQLDTAESLNVLKGHSGQVMSVVFSSDAQTLITGSADGTIKFWHLETGEQLGVLTNDSAGSVMSVAISPDGQLIAGGSADGTIKIWRRN
jgi:WD40 repeat protein